MYFSRFGESSFGESGLNLTVGGDFSPVSLKTRRADGSDNGSVGMARRPVHRCYAGDGSSLPRSRLRRAT